MDIIGLIKSIKSFFKKDKKVSYDNQNIGNDEKTKAYRELEDEKFKEMRIEELENAVQQSFDACDYVLSNMKNKVQNIAGHLSYEKKISYGKTVKLFEDGVQICDNSLINPFKFSKVIKYYYENFYSDEKQLEYYNHTQAVTEKYNILEKELNEKYK